MDVVITARHDRQPRSLGRHRAAANNDRIDRQHFTIAAAGGIAANDDVGLVRQINDQRPYIAAEIDVGGIRECTGRGRSVLERLGNREGYIVVRRQRRIKVVAVVARCGKQRLCSAHEPRIENRRRHLDRHVELIDVLRHRRCRTEDDAGLTRSGLVQVIPHRGDEISEVVTVDVAERNHRGTERQIFRGQADRGVGSVDIDDIADLRVAGRENDRVTPHERPLVGIGLAISKTQFVGRR